MALVRLTRRVTFSSGHRYWIPSLSDGENRALFGKWASPYNHGHNYVLDVTCEGEVDPETGMVVNIKDIDRVLQEWIVAQFDGKSINDEIPFFASKAASLENIVCYIRDELAGTEPLRNWLSRRCEGGLKSVELTSLHLEETPTLWVEFEAPWAQSIPGTQVSRLESSTPLPPSSSGTNHPDEEGEERDNENWIMTLTRTYEFAASHRLYNPALPEAENEALFGKCANPAGHGHNYILEVTVEGTPDARTGMMVDLEAFDQIVEREVVERYDHKNLSVDLPEFAKDIATTENIALQIFERLKVALPVRLARVRVHETARNVFEVSRDR